MLRIDKERFQGLSTIIYGASGTGKSMYLKTLLYGIHNAIDEAYIYTITNLANNMYSDITREENIHYLPGLTIEDFGNMTEKESNAVMIQTLQNIYNRQATSLKFSREVFATKEKVKEKMDSIITEIAANAYGALHNKIPRSINREATDKSRDELYGILQRLLEYKKLHAPLSEDEELIINTPIILPNVLLVFDDCAALMKRVVKHNILKNIIYTGRHYKITLIMAAQNVTDIDPDVRKCVHHNIFTTESIANAWINYQRDNFRDHRQEYLNITNAIYKRPYMFAYATQERGNYRIIPTTSRTNLPKFGLYNASRFVKKKNISSKKSHSRKTHK